MLVKLEIENFRGNRGHSYGPFTRNTVIRGANEAGKSTIKEAICFAFTGRDSYGNTAPTHLITFGEKKCSVAVTTEKATIVRTLTDKKSSTLKVVRGEMSTTYTQTDFEKLVGSPDLFLSIFVPGYFFRIPQNRRQAVLDEALPKPDKRKILEGILMDTLTAEERLRYAVQTTRADLVEAKVANDRREVQQQVAEIEGKIQALSSLQPQAEPVEPLEVSELERLGVLHREWFAYGLALKNYEDFVRRRDQVVKLNEGVEAHKKQLASDLSRLVFPQIPDSARLQELKTAIRGLEDSLQVCLVRPQEQLVVESASCPTCGQVVGLKHRDKVLKENEKLIAEWEVKRAEVEAHNTKVRLEITKLTSECDLETQKVVTAQHEFRQVQDIKTRLEAELKAAKLLPLPEEVQAPVRPSEGYSADRHLHVKQVVNQYHQELGSYKNTLKLVANRDAEIQSLQLLHHNKSEVISRLKRIELALKDLPAAVLRVQEQFLSMSGFSLVTEGEVTVLRNDNIPFTALSAGARIRAELALSRKLNSLLSRKVGMYFVDDSDLLDSHGVVDVSPDEQFFWAKVDQSVGAVTLS